MKEKKTLFPLIKSLKKKKKNLILYCVSPSSPSLFTETFRGVDKLGLCLSLGNTAASIHVMNSAYFFSKGAKL